MDQAAGMIPRPAAGHRRGRAQDQGRLDRVFLVRSESYGIGANVAPPDPQEIALLREVERNLEAVVAGGDTDPKVQVVLHYLCDRRWLDTNGAIIFSLFMIESR